MLARENADGLAVVTQPAHSWISGQLARAWGNARFGFFEPREEVCLAAALHDVGFARWDLCPSYNPVTKRPHTFMDMPSGRHLELWAEGVERMAAFGAYPALLVSMHHTRLCERFHQARNGEEAREKEGFLAEQRAFQERMLGHLRNDPVYVSEAGEAAVERNHQLMAAWDYLSLELLLNSRGEIEVGDVPFAEGNGSVKLVSQGGRFQVEPWPFQVEPLELRVEMRRLDGAPFADEKAMREALRGAAAEQLRICLEPR